MKIISLGNDMSEIEPGTSMRCADCGEELEWNSEEPCPNCGSIYKTVEMKIVLPPLVESAKISETSTEEKGRDINWPLLILALIITFCSPFLGLFVSWFDGVIIGLIIGACTFYMGYKAITKTKNRDNHHYE